MAGETNTAPATFAGEYGVDEALTGYTIETLVDTSTPQREIVYDQYNRRVKEIRYDTLKSIRLTVRGNTASNVPAAVGVAATTSAPITGSDLLLGGVHFIVDSIEKAGSYNGLKRFNVDAHSTTLCTAETAMVTASDSSSQSEE